jgi:hypothetical protein
LGKPNYFLYFVGKGVDNNKLNPGECGIGRTSLKPGVCDARWGTMLIAPYDYVWQGRHGVFGDMGDPEIIKRIILRYFGHR